VITYSTLTPNCNKANPTNITMKPTVNIGNNPNASAIYAATIGATTLTMLCGRKLTANPIPICLGGLSFAVKAAVAGIPKIPQKRYTRYSAINGSTPSVKKAAI